MTSIFEKLQKIVGNDSVTNSEYIRYCYSKTGDCIYQEVPDFVIRPRTSEEISEILQIANNEIIPVTPRGGGAGLFGGAVPHYKGIVIDMTSMNKILDINIDDQIVTAECGITWAELNSQLLKKGFYTGAMGPGSGMSAVIGGGLSHNSVGGGGGAKYGSVCRHVVGLEVVLPQGDIINTGSLCSKYVKEPFSRYGFGPDFSGIFLGDNGIYGIKTNATLQIYPKPPYYEARTFVLKRSNMKFGVNIFLEWLNKGGFGIYDGFYFPDYFVMGMSAMEPPTYIPWKKLSKAAIFYTTEAFSEKELEANIENLDAIVMKNKGKPLGPEIEDGNFAKFQYPFELNGNYSFYQNTFGIPKGSQSLSTEAHCPIRRFPEIINVIDKWGAEHAKDFAKIQEKTGIPAGTGCGSVGLSGESNVELAIGFVTSPAPELRELNLNLWMEQMAAVIKAGGMHYMLGYIASRELVKTGAFSDEYYNFMRGIKKLLDPNNILSPGKFMFEMGEKE